MLIILTETPKLLVVPDLGVLFLIWGTDLCSEAQAMHPEAKSPLWELPFSSPCSTLYRFSHSGAKPGFLLFFLTVDFQASPSRFPALSPSSLFFRSPPGPHSMTKALQEYFWTRISTVTL